MAHTTCPSNTKGSSKFASTRLSSAQVLVQRQEGQAIGIHICDAGQGDRSAIALCCQLMKISTTNRFIRISASSENVLLYVYYLLCEKTSPPRTTSRVASLRGQPPAGDGSSVFVHGHKSRLSSNDLWMQHDAARLGGVAISLWEAVLAIFCYIFLCTFLILFFDVFYCFMGKVPSCIFFLIFIARRLVQEPYTVPGTSDCRPLSCP